MKIAALLFVCGAAWAQQPLTLDQAESLAIQNHPRMKSTQLTVDSAKEIVTQARSAYKPVVSANVTASAADHLSRIGAGGGLNASSIFSRFASGIVITGPVWDFGRTSNIVSAARSRVEAASETVNASRADIRIEVRRAYFNALLAQSTVRVARETLEARRLVLKQVSALADSNLRSTLDVGFAEVSVSEAELAVANATTGLNSTLVDLSAAMGMKETVNYSLADAPAPLELSKDAEAMAKESVARPELEARRLLVKAARSFAEAERRLAYPTLTGLGVAGVVPAGDERLKTRYSGVGLNLNIPLYNGDLNRSRRRDADLKVKIAEMELLDAEIRIGADVKRAWLAANDSFQRLPVTAKLLEQARRTLRLAQTRYELGLGNIVELNQAQLSRFSAEIAEVTARYEYQLRRSVLDYAAGLLK
ncbi:MAG: TolC family protein [Acidobacteria bacterium]|nr:TolC family protein [Acidobacteriota bacterium]